MGTSGGDIVVVGAGIVGSSIAYHVAHAGETVTLIDTGSPGAGVTSSSFAWIASSGLRTGPAGDLRLAATEVYRRLEDELPGLPVTWSGALVWGDPDEPVEIGPGQEVVDADAVAELEPNPVRPPERAVWAAGDGAVDPTGVVERLVTGAREHGAVVCPDERVATVVRGPDGRVSGVETAEGMVAGDVVVLAAGVGTGALAATVGVTVPVGPSPCPLHRFTAPPDLVRTVVSNRDFDLRQVAPDRLVAAADSAEDALATVRSTFRGAEDVALVSTSIGVRPMPADGEPIIGPVGGVPGLYVATLHAAVTLGPGVGRLVAQELVDGSDVPMLAGCRLDRF